MYRILLLLTAFLMVQPFINAQYIPLSYPAGSGNPNGLHRNDDIQNPMPGQGWTIIYNAADTLPKWTNPITMPFPFWFNKIQRGALKVSNTGIITFDTNSVALPADTSVILPKKDFPNAAIYMLGLSSRQNQASITLNPSARIPMIRTRVFGFAPNRQFWISFTGFSFMHSKTQYASICNWSVMLEESSNFVYVVDQSTFSYETSQNGLRPDTTNIGLSIGLQINDSVGVMLGERIGSTVFNPRIGFEADFTSEDNAYHVFRPKDAIPVNDMSVSDVQLGDLTAGSKSGIPIPVIVRNNGSDTVKTFRLRYAQDNAKPVDTSFSIIIPPSQTASCTTALWSPKLSKRYQLTIWCDSINGNNPDEYVVNDTAKILTAYMVNPPQKQILVEHFTSPSCGECPRTTTSIDSAIQNAVDVHTIAYHIGDGPMNMKRSDTIALLYEAKAGDVMIDRTYFKDLSRNAVVSVPRNSAFVQGKPIVDALRSVRSNPTPVDLRLYHVFNNPTRTLSSTLYATFEAEVSGDFRINAMLVEDSVQGDSRYDQSNAMAGDTTIPIWGNAPSSINGFSHRNVARMILDSSQINGTPDSMAYDTQIGKTYTCSYTKILPSTLNIQKLNLVAFILDYNPDPVFGRVLNTISSPVRKNITTIDENVANESVIIHPQPATDMIMLQCMLPEGSATLEIHSMLGTSMHSEHVFHSGDPTFVFQHDVSSYPAGIYVITLKSNGKQMHQTMRIVR